MLKRKNRVRKEGSKASSKDNFWNENFWMVLLPICILLTFTAIDDVQTGIAGIATSHLLNRPTTPFWFGMIFCVGVTVAMYTWLGFLIRNALHRRKSSGDGL